MIKRTSPPCQSFIECQSDTHLHLAPSFSGPARLFTSSHLYPFQTNSWKFIIVKIVNPSSQHQDPAECLLLLVSGVLLLEPRFGYYRYRGSKLLARYHWEYPGSFCLGRKKKHHKCNFQPPFFSNLPFLMNPDSVG